MIVGVGQVNWIGPDVPEPAELLAEAARRAGADSGAAGLLKRLDSIRVVKAVSWRYRDLGALIGSTLGVSPTHTQYTTDGGQTPQVLLNRAAADIAAGRADVILIGGTEAWRERKAYSARGERPEWTLQPEGQKPTEIVGPALNMTNDDERAIGITDPIEFYPLFESAYRHSTGRPLADHTRAISELWARFSAVAADNPHAALPRHHTAEEIGTPSPGNRMVGFPYTKLMNANNRVNQAAALLVCSLEAAQAAGVASDRMVFPVAGAEADDIPFVSNRESLSSSPAIRAAGRAALKQAGVGVDDLTHVDLYSCFPSAVQIAAAELGLALDRPLTVTGGLTFAGGPWNNYVTHSIATMVDRLRRQPGLGLCSANGGLLTKHAIGIYANEPPGAGFRAEKLGTVGQERPLAVGQRSRATVEAYTVMHDRSGTPTRAHLTARLPDGRRSWAASDDPAFLDAIMQTDACGTPIELLGDGTCERP